MIRAYVLAKVGASEYLGTMKTLKEEIAKIPGVLKVHVIFGRYDIIAEAEAKDLEELSNVIVDKIRSMPNVSSTETFICW